MKMITSDDENNNSNGELSDKSRRKLYRISFQLDVLIFVILQYTTSRYALAS
jgi:hypothetical protein